MNVNSYSELITSKASACEHKIFLYVQMAQTSSHRLSLSHMNVHKFSITNKQADKHMTIEVNLQPTENGRVAFPITFFITNDR